MEGGSMGGGSMGGAPSTLKSARRYSQVGQSVEGSVAVGAGLPEQGVVHKTGGGAKEEDGGLGCREAAASNELVVQVLGNWGHDKIVGLTEVELFDRSASRVRLANAQVPPASSYHLEPQFSTLNPKS